MKTWTIDCYNNTGQGDEGFYEWWEISNGTATYKADNEKDAGDLFLLLNASERKDDLLRAAYDLIRRSLDSHYIGPANETLVHYDGANCDGYCLADDIAVVLNLPDDTKPIPLSPET